MEVDMDAPLAAPSDLLQNRRENENAEGDPNFSTLMNASGKDDPLCCTAETTLLVPFSFWTEEDELSSTAVSRMLFSRTVPLVSEVTQHERTLDHFPLWEYCFLSDEVVEFALPFRTLWGLDSYASAVSRMRVTDAVRNGLFSGAILWTLSNAGTRAGRRCEWRDVQLFVFPNSAVLSIKVEWVITGGHNFHLSDLRTWVFISKFRSVDAGDHMGWEFLRPHFGDEALVSEITKSLGLELHSSLVGGVPVSLHVIANWLVKFPSDVSTVIPLRISRHEYCLHRTFAVVDHKPRREKLTEFLYHVGRALGIREINCLPTQSSGLSDQLLRIYPRTVLSVAREGVLGLCWGSLEEHRTFQLQFHGALHVLSIQALSERVTLERLSYLMALRCQSMWAPPMAHDFTSVGPDDAPSLNSNDKVRKDIARLSYMLMRYRSCMSSDDCGGRPEYGEYFLILRQLYFISELKEEIAEKLQDVLSVVHRGYTEEYQRAKALQEEWELKRDEIASSIRKVRVDGRMWFLCR